MSEMKLSTQNKKTEISPDELTENRCKVFEMGGKKGAICMEKGKIIIYELDSVNT
jgi:hypothetical protein